MELSETLSVYNDIVARSDAYVVTDSDGSNERSLFPTRANLVQTLATNALEQANVGLDAMRTRVLLHQRVWFLLSDFLTIKQTQGSAAERAVYERMTPRGLVSRLLTKRAMAFYDDDDAWMVVVTGKAFRGRGGWERVGTDAEVPPLLVRDVLSYDEIPLAALLVTSGPTRFINDGNRHNDARPGPDGSFAPHGIFATAVGPRFERLDQMESRFLLVPPASSAPGGPVSQMWARFYATDAPPKLLPVDKSGRSLDVNALRVRYDVVVHTLLWDAQQRGAAVAKRVHVRMAGLGLGVWRLHDAQSQLLAEAVVAALERLRPANVACVEFQWWPRPADVPSAVGPVRLLFTKDSVATPLLGAGEVLYGVLPFDGNAHVGNEYWVGHMHASGDPAGACCSTLAQLQNPDINPDFVKRVCVVAA